jgi:hypothetical protein
MKAVHVVGIALLATMHASTIASAQTSESNPAFVPAKYCCEMPSVGQVCVVFKADGSYAATGTLAHKNGTSRGIWMHEGTKGILTPTEESGCLVGYLTRFNIDEHVGGSLSWLPKTPQNFGRSGGALVYPQCKKVNGNLN